MFDNLSDDTNKSRAECFRKSKCADGETENDQDSGHCAP